MKRSPDLARRLDRQRVRSMSKRLLLISRGSGLRRQFRCVGRDVLSCTNSEGSTLRLPDSISTRACPCELGQAPDGMTRPGCRRTSRCSIRRHLPSDAGTARKRGSGRCSGSKHCRRRRWAKRYSGPVLFEGPAAAQLMAEVLGPQFALPRKPISEPGRPAPFMPSEFEGRIGSRVLPNFSMSSTIRTQKAWHGTPLLGYFDFDYEGVVPAPLTLVEKGKLKTFLLTRQPVRDSMRRTGVLVFRAPTARMLPRSATCSFALRRP